MGDRTVTASELVLAARSLADEVSDSPEYGRALVDLVARALRYDEKDRSLVSIAILAKMPGPSSQPEPLIQPLTKREIEILGALADGRPRAVVAGELFISKRTLEKHVFNICTKTGTNSLLEALGVARRAGLLANLPQ